MHGFCCRSGLVKGFFIAPEKPLPFRRSLSVVKCPALFLHPGLHMVHIGLINPKDVTNVGSVLRAIGCFQADGLIYTGNRYNTAMRYRTDTKNVQENVPARHVKHILDACAELPAETKVVCVELVVGATPLPEFEHPPAAFYIFGPEDGNLPQQVVDAADEVVYIPTVGCLNLAATANILLYDRMVKCGLAGHEESRGEELIRGSRDNNNQLKVRKPPQRQS